MSAMQTAIGGALVLAVLDAAVSSTAAAGRVGSIFTSLAKVMEHLLSPTVPMIPDLRKQGPPQSSAPSTSGGPAAGSLVPPDWTTSPTVPA